jgi:hypothetical protein
MSSGLNTDQADAFMCKRQRTMAIPTVKGTDIRRKSVEAKETNSGAKYNPETQDLK